MSAKEYKHPIPKSLESNRTAFTILKAVMREYVKRGLLNSISLNIRTANQKHYAVVFFHPNDGDVVYIDFYNRHFFRERWDELIDKMDEVAERMRKEREQKEKEEMEEAV